MSESELTRVIQNKIIGVGKILIVLEGELVDTTEPNTFCVLALVEREKSLYTEHALFVFTSSDLPPHSNLNQLVCNQVLPIDKQFFCDLLPNEGRSNVRVQLRDSGGLSVCVLLPEHEITQKFIAEIFRVVDIYDDTISRNITSWSNLSNPSVTMTDNPITRSLSAELSLQEDGFFKNGQPSLRDRESKIKYFMTVKTAEYTYTNNIRILVATWNVNGKAPTTSTSLNDWLTSDPDPPDIYAIGFQELDLTKEAFLFNETPREGEWFEAVSHALKTRGIIYRNICVVRLVGMMLLVFIKDAHYQFVKNVACETVGTGIMGKMGNKGGVGCRFDFHSTSICFINSHLAAHVEEFERRNQDFHSINSRMVFTAPSGRFAIKDHDQIYWLGDLNYRVTDLDVNLVKTMLMDNNLKPVLDADQLKQQRRAKRVFDGFHEGKILFQPTYKYDTGTDNWDSSEKHRAPAWCDRVLWKVSKNLLVEQIEYRSHSSLKISDHKPVSSLFNSQIRIIDESKQRKVHEEVIKYFDRIENEFLPQVTVDTNEIIFPTIRYLEPVERELIIANTGQVPAQFAFIKKLDDPCVFKVWLKVEPVEGIILPGEKCDVKLEVLVDKRTACKLNSGEDKIYDILVLHLDGGKDIFVTVSGDYERSCFGCSIEALVHIPVPIKEIPIGKLVQLENNRDLVASGGTEPYPIPKEIWFLVDHLYRHGLKQPLFVQAGLTSELYQIRDWLDNGSSDPLPGSVFSMAEALLLLLESTAEPVIPYNLHNVCANLSGNYLQCKQIVQSLPTHRRNVFLYLCVFLQELLTHSSENELEAKFLAPLFGGIFLREPPNRKDEKTSYIQQELVRKKGNFVYHFLVNDQTDFILGR